MDIAYRLSEKSGMLQDEHAEHAAAAKYWLKEGPDGQSLASKYNNYMRTHDPAKVKVMSDDDVFDAIKGDAGNHGKTLGELDRSGILN